jgi:hypothetical protein
MHIILQVRNVYGNDLVYPMCDTSALLARLAGAKTFNRGQLATIKALGYEIRVAAGRLPWTV